MTYPHMATDPDRYMQRARTSRQTALQNHERRLGDEGFTLIELLVAMTVLSVVLALTATVLNAFYGSENAIQASYRSFTQVLPASTTLQDLFRTMVEPAPPSNSQPPVPVPTFSVASGGSASGPFQLAPNTVQFTSDLGNANGPTLVTATTTPNASPAGTYTLTVTVTDPNPGTCPGVSSGTACTYTQSNARRAFQITDLTNGSTTASPPLFQYELAGSTTPVTYSTTSTSAWQTDFGSGSCKSENVCPADQVQTVLINVEVQAPGGDPASYQTEVSALAPKYSQYVG